MRILLLAFLLAAVAAKINPEGVPVLTGGPVMVGGATEVQEKNPVQARKDILLSAEIVEAGTEKSDRLGALLKDENLLRVSSQPVAGTNMRYLYKTARGYECFRIYIPLPFMNSPNKLSRYAIGSDIEKVWGDCNSFWATPEGYSLARAIFDEKRP